MVNQNWAWFGKISRALTRALSSTLLVQILDTPLSMSSNNVGVQARIREVCPLALYTHCHSHQLNLCVIKACSIPNIRNANGVISEIAKYFNYSPNRQHFFKHVIDSVTPAEKRVKLKDLCRTRWVERIK